MNVVAFTHFEKDIRKIRDKTLAVSVKKIITRLQSAKSISQLPNIKKIKAPGNYYRIRVGDYRLGIKQEQNSIFLLCFMHRKDIYKYFPQNF